MAYEELFPTRGPPPPEAKIVIAPPDIDVSPQISLHMPKAPLIPLYALYQAGHAIQDLLKAGIQISLIDKLSAQLPGIANWPMSLCFDAKTLPLDDLASEVLKDIGEQYKFLMTAWKASIGAGMGAAYASEIEQFMNPGQMLYAYSTLQYQVSVVPRMRRYWHSLYTPTVPNTSMAYNLMLRGAITDSQFRTYASWDGWGSDGIEFLKEVWKSVPNPWAAFRLMRRGAITPDNWKRYVRMDGWPAEWADKLEDLYETIPSAREAFYLWMKGQITEEGRNKLYYAEGMSSEWWGPQTENWYYVPTLYDLTRIADYVELDQIWALDAMKRRGVSEKDRAKVWEMLEIRPIRDEIRAKTTHATFCRRYGYWSKEAFEDFLADLTAKKYIRPKEKELITQYGEDLYEQELKMEWVEILRWRFRTAVISDEEFFEGLTDPKGPVAMVEEKANLIVELEKAKGYYGYY